MSRLRMLLCTICALTLAFACLDARAYTPESAKVQAMVGKAVTYLEKQDGKKQRIGADCLIAYTIKKASGRKGHPFVLKVLERCREACDSNGLSEPLTSTYNTAMVAIFLAEVSPQQNRNELQAVINALVKMQKPHGAWGYPQESIGDTSQTQLCILALWSGQKVGMRVPPDVFAKSCRWLLRTQDPRGCWAYKGVDPGNSGKRIEQSQLSHNAHSYFAVTAAGLGSLYICADALGITGFSERDNVAQFRALPPSMRVLEPDDDGKPAKRAPKRRSTGGIALPWLALGVKDGNAWFMKNNTMDPPMPFTHYFRYSYERYASFRESAEKYAPLEPNWYNEGVDFLATKQEGDGGFSSGEANVRVAGGKPIATAFAVLFLIRSTKKSIKQAMEGGLTGGKGLPDGAIRMNKDGKIVTSPISKQLGDLLALIEDEESEEDIEAMLKNAIFDFDSNKETAKEQIARLRDLVTHEKFAVRKQAVEMLGRQRNLDNVPALVFALTDPSWRVVTGARNGLRFISRRLDGFGIPNKKDENAAKRGIIAWKQWYRSIRPDAIFFDE